MSIFNDLFVLELANNHRGDVNRGLKIIEEFARVVREHGVRAMIKLQFRDRDSYVHKAFRERSDLPYVKKVMSTFLTHDEYGQLVAAIRNSGCIAGATPFDEPSVDLCVKFDLPIIKVASCSINDWPLLLKVAETRKPVIISTGGATERETDEVTAFFCSRGIEFALNHCVSLYPTGRNELELNQIDYLRDRYPGISIGLSSHEYEHSGRVLVIAYAKGARLFERHIDIQGLNLSPYCSTPEQISKWFGSHFLARQMCGGKGKRIPTAHEVEYLRGMKRGMYAKRDLPAGHILDTNDVYFAVPLQDGQLAAGEGISGCTQTGCRKDEPPMTSMLRNP